MKQMKVCLFVGMVMWLASSCSLVPDGRGQRFTKELCDDPGWVSQVGDTYSYQVRTSTADADSIKIGFKGFYGRDTVWELITHDTVVMPYVLEIIDSRSDVFKVVLVDEGTGHVRTMYQQGMEREGHIELTAGRHTIKLVGHDAQGEISLHLTVPLGVLAIDRFTNRW